MRRALLSCTVVAILLALPSPAQAALAGDSVVLTGAPVSTGIFTLHALEARSGPSGEQPSGQVRFAAFDVSFVFGGPVTCLAVSGHTAVINFQDQIGPFGIVTITVLDGAPDMFDLVAFGRSPSDCSPAGPSSLAATLPHGGISVIDAPPLPTFAEQCKGGSWRTFGVFRNQGDCVSFVATRGKNPPSDP